MPWLIWRYLLWRQLRAIALSTAIVMGAMGLAMAMPVLGRGLLGGEESIRLVVVMMMMMSPMTIPISAGIGAAMALQRLEQQQELVACSRLGFSHLQLITPTLVLALALTAGSAWLSQRTIPRFARQAAQFVAPDPIRMIQRQIKNDMAVQLGDWRLKARESAILQGDGAWDESIQLDSLVLIHPDADGSLLDDATAGRAVVTMKQVEGKLQLSAELFDVLLMNHRRSQLLRTRQWQLPEWSAPIPERPMNSYTRRELDEVHAQPWSHPRVIKAAGPIQGARRAQQMADLWSRIDARSTLRLRRISDGSGYVLGGFQAARKELTIELRSAGARGWIDMLQENKVIRRIQAPETILTLVPSRIGDWPEVQMQITPTVQIADTPEHKRENLKYAGLSPVDPPGAIRLESGRLLEWAAGRQDSPGMSLAHRGLIRAIDQVRWMVAREQWKRIGLVVVAGLAPLLAWTIALRFHPRFTLVSGIAVFLPILAVEIWIDGADALVQTLNLNANWIGPMLMAGPLAALMASMELYRQKRTH